MKHEESVARGGKLRTETGPEREKGVKGENRKEAVQGRPMKDTGVSRSISGGSVPTM